MREPRATLAGWASPGGVASRRFARRTPRGSRETVGTRDVRVACGTWRLIVSRVPPSNRELARAYDRASARWRWTSALLGYDAAYAELFANLRRRGWLAFVPLGARVLDVGAGTGALAGGLPRDLAARLSVHAVDVSPGMLAHAAERLAGHSGTLELLRADAQHLPFSDGAFALVMAAHVLEHAESPRGALAEMARVLAPGGRLLIVTTRRTSADAVLRLTWRYRSLRGTWLLGAMRRAGLVGIRRCRVGRRWRPARWLSVAYLGEKPR